MRRATTKKRIRLCLEFLTFAAALCCCSSACAAADEAPGYARFCTIMTPDVASGASYRASMAERAQKNEAGLAPDRSVVQAVAQRLGLATTPTIVARTMEIVDPSIVHDPGDVTALVGALDPVAPRYWLASVTAAGTLHALTPAGVKSLQLAVGFPRSMAPFILENDLLGGDTTVPRAGCAALFDAWFGLFPAVNAVLHAAILAEPAQDPALAVAVRAAWKALHPDDSGPPGRGALTRETQRALGTDPAVTLVFRDVGLPGDGIGEIDVVRIGGRPHTYAIVTGKRPISLDGQALCVVGDVRCSRYYVWP